MNPSGDAKTFYKTHLSRESRELAEQKAKEAREQLRDKLELGEVNRFERNNNTEKRQSI